MLNITDLIGFGDGGTGNGSISYVSSSSITGTVNNISASVPAGVQNGDLILFVACSDSNDTITMPTGSTAIVASASSWNSVFVSFKVANNESGSYAFAGTGGSNKAAFAMVYRNCSTTGIAGSPTKSSGSSVSTGASITPASPGLLFGVFFIESSTATIANPPTGMTSRSQASRTNMTAVIYDVLQNPSGSTGTLSTTWNTSNGTCGLLLQMYGI